MSEQNATQQHHKATYTVPRLMQGYQIARRSMLIDGEPQDRYYLQQVQSDGTWRDVRGPYKQSTHAKEWLRRRRFHELMEAKKRGAIIVFLDHEEG